MTLIDPELADRAARVARDPRSTRDELNRARKILVGAHRQRRWRPTVVQTPRGELWENRA